MKRLVVVLLAGTFMIYGADAVHAWHVSGKVMCDNAEKTPLSGVTVKIGEVGEPMTGADGSYYLKLPDVAADYESSLIEGLPLDPEFVEPQENSRILNIDSTTSCGQMSFDWLIDSPLCGTQACWLTGGGVKFSPIVGANLAEFDQGKKGPVHNFGGNVNPGCSPIAGEGGQWNHIFHNGNESLHFQGTAISVVRCGNVPGIVPPGSESPVTPYNFIEFEGTGTLKGIKGNKDVDLEMVYFIARAEDRNEPGNEKANGGGSIDRYYLNVYTDPGDPIASSQLLVSGNEDIPGTEFDGVTITGGNLQLHISSCDNPPQF